MSTTRSPLAPMIVVDPPMPSAPLHSLVASAVPVDDGEDRWEMGFTFWPYNCVAASAWFAGCEVLPTVGNDETTVGPAAGGLINKSNAPLNNPVQVYFPPTLETAFKCDATGWEDINYAERARLQMEQATSNALEFEFWTGTMVPENYNLVGDCPGLAAAPGGCSGILNPTASGLWTAVKPQDALALLVGALAGCASGAPGMIHAPSQIVELWAESFALIQNGPRLMTKTRGNVIVSGGGYPGTGPAALATATIPGQSAGSAAAQVTPGPGAYWCYATDAVVTRLGEIEVIPDNIGEAFVRTANGGRTNTIEFRAERQAAAYCGACATFAVLVSTTEGT
jgi:hypothetical protein